MQLDREQIEEIRSLYPVSVVAVQWDALCDMALSSIPGGSPIYGDAVCAAADHVGIPREQIDRFLGTLQMCGWHLSPVSETGDTARMVALFERDFQDTGDPATKLERIRKSIDGWLEKRNAQR